jgi:aldose 1-epimerase
VSAPVFTPITIASGSLTATLCPHIGGSIARLTLGNVDILRRASDDAIEKSLIRQMASYPLVPYSNRIVDGTLVFRGRRHALTPNFPPERHAIHGVGWRRVWRVESHDTSTLKLSLDHQPDADWPFHFSATQSFEVTGDALRVAITLGNTGASPMPAGLGFHPFFPRSADTQLQTHWRGKWAMSDAKVPVEWATVTPRDDFSMPRAVGDWTVDNCFTGWSRAARLTYATHVTDIGASEVFASAVCFVPTDGRPFIAIEPVSHVVDAFNLHERGSADTGTRILAPGENLAGSMTIRASLNAPAGEKR